MTNQYDRERAADAAFFEDWGEFSVLDGLPEKKGPVRSSRRDDYSRYYCILRRNEKFMGGPVFEICIPNSGPITDRVKRLPGCRQTPGLYGRNSVANMRLRGTYFVPAEHWRMVQKTLPILKAEVTAWSQSRR
ncbi:MAG: hypothetical protein JWM58_1643 [Rhizobium sp.]|nr:hypothetical protein [Rhizobium sp.]